MSVTWVPLIGEYDFGAKKIKFLGREIEWDHEGEPQMVPSIGAALSSHRFSGGRIEAEFVFKDDIDEKTACELLLYHDPASGFFVTAGLGGGYNMFNIRHYDGKRWFYHRQTGDRSNLDVGEKYKVAAVVRGSWVSLSVNDIEVTAVDLPFSLPESQAGLWCMGRHEIHITGFNVTSQKPSVFVVMQFSSPFNEIYSEVIKDVCDEFKLDVIRADERYGPGLIIADVARDISRSKMVIAEITPANPNVYYEVGYAHASNKPTILLAEKPTELPFDVSPFRTLFYENTIHGKSGLEEGLRRHIREILFPTTGF